jgi:hypothetical protein
MSEPYNRFTGQSIERLTALSDGLFAVAMTLLVLDLRVPVLAAGLSSEHGLWAALLKLGPSFAAYLLSFTMLATFRRRIVLAQSGYTLAALVCLLSTQASVIALAVVQLYYIVSPRLPRIQRERA